MTITTVAANDRRSGPYTASAAQTTFAYDFPIYEDADLRVTRERAGVETVLALTTDYTVTGAEDPAGGTVELVAGSDEDDILTIDGALPIVRTTAFIEGGELPADEVNRELNRFTMMEQEQNRDIDDARELAEAAASQDYVDDAVAAIAADLAASAAAAAASAATAAAEAAAAAAALESLLGGGGLADAPVSPAMQPVVVAATLAAARTALGLGTAATSASGDFQAAGAAALKANNLSDLAAPAAARTNLGLGALAVTGAGTGLEVSGGNTQLTDTGVTADTYGDASTVPQITVDDQGRVTGVVDVPIDVDSGAWARISAGSGTTAVSTVAIALPAGYSKYRLELLDLAPASASKLRLRFSTNNGVSYDSTAAYEYFTTSHDSSSDTHSGSASGTAIIVNEDNQATNARILGWVEIDPANKMTHSMIGGRASGGGVQATHGFGEYGGSTPTHVQLSFTSGNVSRYKYVLTGMV